MYERCERMCVGVSNRPSDSRQQTALLLVCGAVNFCCLKIAIQHQCAWAYLGCGIYERVPFDADPNKNLNKADLNLFYLELDQV